MLHNIFYIIGCIRIGQGVTSIINGPEISSYVMEICNTALTISLLNNSCQCTNSQKYKWQLKPLKC